jgi:hypothetical protein
MRKYLSCRESELSQFPNGFPLCGDKFTTLTILRFFFEKSVPYRFLYFALLKYPIFSAKK